MVSLASISNFGTRGHLACERLAQALADPARRYRTALLLCLAYGLAWALYAVIAKSSQDLHPDMTELIAWSRPPPTAAGLAVGDGQAILLAGPRGAVLIDGGPSPARLAGALGARLPPWQRRLEALVITGPGRQHVGGLASLDYAVGTVVTPGAQLDGSAWRSAALSAVARGAALRAPVAGELMRLAGFEVEVLAPEAAEPAGGQLALRVRGPSDRSFCDLADLDPEAQVGAAGRLRGGCDYLLLASGGRSAPAPELMRAARPGRLVASLASGHLARELAAATVSRTDQEGTIVLDL